MIRGWWFLLLAGCGRVAFDVASDAQRPSGDACTNPVGHDEDHDGVDDACDGCPHVADPAQPDGDGDGVTDACDPHPTTAGDRIALFDAFTGPSAALEFNGDLEYVAGDRLRINGRPEFGYASITSAIGDDDLIQYEGTVTTLGTTQVKQATLVAHDGVTAGFYYCEVIRDDDSYRFQSTVTYDDVDYQVLDSQNLAGTFSAGPLQMRLRNTPPSYACDTSVPSATTRVAAIPADMSATRIDFGAEGIDLEVDYLVRFTRD